MITEDFTLKSGTTLKVTSAGFEDAINLIEACKKASIGIDAETDVNDLILASPEVRKALYRLFPLALYGTIKVTPGLFDDPNEGNKARGDYFEICSRIIEVNSKLFFSKSSSASRASRKKAGESPEQP